MFNKIFKIKILFIILFFSFNTILNAEIVNKIEVKGNDRISSETIKMFSEVSTKDDLNENDLNRILKNLYNSNFFELVNVKLENNILQITVKENPIIQNIEYNGIKSDTMLSDLKKNAILKSRSSFNEIILKNDQDKIAKFLKELGYYFSEIDISIEELQDNKVNLTYNILLGDKAKIKKISFIGNKIFKDKKLKNIILSEEYKSWKFLSGKKFLNEAMIKYDERLLRNFYLNKGFYNVQINSSYAKILENQEFELIFNIDANPKIYFGKLELDLPTDFSKSNYESIEKFFSKLENEPYSLNRVENILEQIEVITINEQYESIKASVNENVVSNKINITFKIEETEKIFIEKINIYGNNITRESVIRNQIEIDEGDPFNQILYLKSVNNIKSLNFFEEVEGEVIDGIKFNSKIINFTVTEKATGEIFAGVGTGTTGSNISFGIKENNYLGRGVLVDSNLSLSETRVKGKLLISNPNYKNSDKSLDLTIQSSAVDQLSTSGYKSNVIGFDLGTKFEYLDDLRFGLATKNSIEEITTDSSASARQKKQAGNYFDSFIGLDFFYDKRNQKFQTTDGFFSNYGLDLPIISDTNTLRNAYDFKIFKELYENNVSTFSILLRSSNSISGDDIKLSERLYIPGNRLRGFEPGKVGPKDGSDFIGGNFLTSINATTTIPMFLENLQTVDIVAFADVANIWGVDYDSSLDKSGVRSSVGIGLDWLTPVGPLTFSLAHPITKEPTDIEETFRFNIGTTF
ncbi:outer membrane protein assembly factor BamA [Candidatus Pelagibacter sp. HIMB1483]|uniref:outer membrane protein assembly factor BamA n=1 Tax=Candidatus Pelagibacter sp. HIMB1483 TaxID=3415414 RepID=UPI003F8670B6